MATELEHFLNAAKAGGDWDTYLRILAGARYLLLDAYRPQVDADPDRAAPLPWRDAEGRNCLIVRTAGEAPDRRAEIATIAETLHWVLRNWPPNAEWLLVNPGSPTEAYFSGAYRQRYAQLAASVPEPKRAFPDVLVADHDGPLHGPTAHGLACGAHLAVHNGVLWNGLGGVYRDYRSDVRILREGWGVANREQWSAQLEALLGNHVSARAEFVLQVRRAVAWRHMGRVDPKVWRDEVAGSLGAARVPRGEAKEVEELVARTLIYEETFRKDGLLPPGGFTGSVLAYDYGRAVTLARCGVSAGLAEPQEAEAAVVRAGEASRLVYRSWEEFSAGYILGRVLSRDDDAFNTAYAGALKPHQVLVHDLASPWRNLPFA